MRTLLLVALLSTACAEDRLTFGDIQAIDDGSGTVEITACLKTGTWSCGNKQLVASHSGASADMTLVGLIAPEYRATMDLADRSEPFVVSDGGLRAAMVLPAPFELAPTPPTLWLGGTLPLRWQAAGQPMVWNADYGCAAGGGWVAGDNVDDDGSVDVSLDHVVDVIRQDGYDVRSCRVAVELSRVSEGSVDAGFRADRATGIVRRTAVVQLR